MRADTTEEFFDRMYRADPDPWHFASSDYEQDRYAATLSALEGRHFQRAFEPGCSVGIMTAKLADLCDEVFAIEISGAAVAKAREHCRDLPQVHIRKGALPDCVPQGGFDLIVFCEIGYYFEEQPLRMLLRHLVEQLDPGGVLLAVHWLGTSKDHVLSGDRVHELLFECAGLQHDKAERHFDFRLDRWSKR